ncbi:MAG: dUTP diphosphatase [Nanoarchaeota archaeon]|nr:dUTP diphosphatase [Nanoarchaeota archaeon]
MVDVSCKKVRDDAMIPNYAHEGDAAFDLHAIEAVLVEPNVQTVVKTGLAFAIPTGYVGLIWDRSGLAVKHGLHTLAGVIDAGYRGEVGIVLINHGTAAFAVEKGMRIAQMLIQTVERVTLTEVENLDETKRGEGGFGSTGH